MDDETSWKIFTRFYMKIKRKYDFFTRCQTPELATEITLMPINQVGPDAAIIFSDILVVLQAMGIKVEMKDNIGPWINSPIEKMMILKKFEFQKLKPN